jgi:hypothetical protein
MFDKAPVPRRLVLILESLAGKLSYVLLSRFASLSYTRDIGSCQELFVFIFYRCVAFITDMDLDEPLRLQTSRTRDITDIGQTVKFAFRFAYKMLPPAEEPFNATIWNVRVPSEFDVILSRRIHGNSTDTRIITPTTIPTMANDMPKLNILAPQPNIRAVWKLYNFVMSSILCHIKPPF